MVDKYYGMQWKMQMGKKRKKVEYKFEPLINLIHPMCSIIWFTIILFENNRNLFYLFQINKL
jgi:hypothetical protein